MESELFLASVGFYYPTDVTLEGSNPTFSEGFLDHIAGPQVVKGMVFFVLLNPVFQELKSCLKHPVHLAGEL